MSKHLRIKITALLIVVAASMIVMGALLTNMQSSLSHGNYDEEMKQEAVQLERLLAEADEETVQNTEQFDAIYQSKAAQVAYMAQNDAGYAETDAKMVELRELLDVDNLFVTDRDGEVLAQSGETKADFTYARFNALRDTFRTHEPSAAVEIELPEQDWLMRYYADRIDDDTMVIVEQNPTELRELIEATGSTASVLRNISIGQHGYVFAVSAKDLVISYHPDEDLIGADAIDAGLNVADLEDGNTGIMKIDGEELFCRVMLQGDTYYISAVPESDTAASGSVTVGVILFVFFAVIAAVTLYGIFVLRDEARHESEEGYEEHYVDHGAFRFNRSVAGKAAVLSIVGFICVLVVSFYMQTLFALSSQSLTNNERVEQIASTIKRSQQRADELTEQYGERYLSKAQVAAYIIDNNPELATRTKLQELADALQIQYVFTFDDRGVMTATNSSFTNFTLSEDPEEQSYEFRKLLQGVEYLVQKPQPDEVSGELRQYIGVTTHDKEGELTGFVQLGIRPTRLENLLEIVQIGNVLDGVQAGVDGFAFAINKSDGTFAYYPDDNMVGKKATDCGMAEDELKDGFSDYITINGKQYYASATETSDYYVFVAGTEGALMNERAPLTITTGVVALVCLAIVFCLLTFDTTMPAEEQTAEGNEPEENRDNSRIVNVNVGDRTVRSESAASRWLNRSFNWDEMTPEQKVGKVLRWFGSAAVIIVFLAIIFKDAVFGEDSLFSYILGGSWERGLNIFAITASLMFACEALTISAIIQKILQMISSVLDARGVTICRLGVSIVKYAAMIGILYWCLGLLGVDTATLLASAGLLTFAVSLGAQGIVSDIIAGLFIIFEGEFRVGDIIQVGGQRGTVMEIGVRTTKINDGSGNILVLRNSNISNVVNMTKEHSFAAVEVGIEYGESLERVESILSKELPNIKDRLPAIVDGPFYKGVTMLADNSVNIKIVAECAEKDRVVLTSDLNREMKLLFDKYDISIPFPQVVVNQPIKFKKATAAEKAAADKFNAEQKEAFKAYVDENEDFDDFNDTDRH
ncbi:mechanosensitive ion channel domain-containing protein [Collinsella tanakaei]|uniref:mechanosensitive ion channel domain-containing protein n=1 Tax=Collinsella tanakaei TaxID=626935 RepID=UPI0025A450CD|nr:mechanosensitive ion channel domain-containing protein [Collinsella tanakaei]MDM8300254.1 mechanosensitive ion channel [Collinsella tanakaei]